MNQPARPIGATTPTNGHNSIDGQIPMDGATGGHVTAEGPVPITLAALVQEAEALHEALTDGRSRAARLISALRRYRKRERLMASALESIKQLKLQDVAG